MRGGSAASVRGGAAGCFLRIMKEEFAFLFPPPGSVRFKGGTLDIRSVCFPLELFKKFDFLFERFGVRNRARGLQVVILEPAFSSPAKGAGQSGEEYVIDCGAGGVTLSAATPRGQFYALSTLLQVLSFYAASGAMPAFSLRDSPVTAFRGACFFRAEAAAAADPLALQRLFLDLALLKFNCLVWPCDPASGSAGEWKALAALARRTGIETLFLDTAPGALSRPAAAGSLPARPLRAPGGEAWIDFFLEQCRAAKLHGVVTAAWSDPFLERPEWIRKIPREVLVLNRGAETGHGERLRAAIQPFREHHVRQVLCPSLCGLGSDGERRFGRILPDGRAAMARVDAACAAAAAAKLAGVLLIHGESQEGGCLPQGAALVRFQAGCRLWSGRPSTPAAFGRWALDRDEPDLYRVCSFLAQSEDRLPYDHARYLFEDPLLAPCSRQGDPRQVVAHYRKAAQYLKKREIAPGRMSGFLDFVAGLHEVIAAKVDLSSRLAALLEDAGGAETLALQAAWLQGAVAGLEELYVELVAAPAPGMLKGFAFLGERFAQLGRVTASPGARESLLTVLRSSALLDAGELPPAGRFPS